jgi:hypothetical protein
VDMQHGHAAWTFSMGMEWTCNTDMHYGHGMQHKNAAWTCRMSLQRGHAARTCRMNMRMSMQHEHAARTWTGHRPFSDRKNWAVKFVLTNYVTSTS